MSELVPSHYKKVTSVEIILGGSGYTSPPTVTFVDGQEGSSSSAFSTATGTAIIENGSVVGVEITNEGWDYISAPVVVFEGGGGSGAQALARMSMIDGYYSDFKNSLQYLVAEQIPDFIRSEYPQFVLFLEKYYEFLEQNNQVNSVLLNMMNFSDVNKTLDEFIPGFRNQYLRYFPKETSIDERLLIKFIRDFYEAKGSKSAIEFLFRALFDEHVEIYYPNDNILRTSDGMWIKDNIIRLTPHGNENVFDLAGKIVTIASYKTIGSVTTMQLTDAVVLDVKKLAYSNPPIFEATLENSINNAPVPGAGGFAEAVLVTEVETTPTGEVLQPGQIKQINITDAGNGYAAVPLITFNSFSGGGAEAKLFNKIDGSGELDRVVVTARGEKYGATNIGAKDFYFDSTFDPISEYPQVIDRTYRFNSDQASSVTEIYIDINDRRGQVVTNWLSSNDVTNTENGNTGYISIFNDDLSKIMLYRVTGEWINQTTLYNWWVIPVEFVWSTSDEDNTFTFGEKVSLSYHENMIAPAVVFDSQPVSTHVHPKDNPTKIYADVLRIISSVSIGTGELAENETDYGFKVNQIFQIDEAETVGLYATNYFGQDYVYGGIDNKAAIKIINVDDNGFPSKVDILFSGYGFSLENFTTTITSSNGSTADLHITTGSQYTTAGRYKNSRGFLSDANKLQDNKYYQPYSYVIRSGVVSRKWMDVIQKTVHPAGMAVFGELVINETVNYPTFRAAKTSQLSLYKYIDDEKVYTSDVYAITFVKGVSDSIAISESSTRAFSKVLTETITSSDSSTRTFGKVVTDSISSPTDVVNNFVISKILIDSVTVTDTVLIGQLREFADSVSITDSAAKSTTKVALDVLSLPTDSISGISVGKNTTDSIASPTDSINDIQVSKALTDSTLMTDSLIAGITAAGIIDSSTVTEIATSSVGKVLTDSLSTPTDSISQIGVSKILTDSTNATDTISNKSVGKVFTDAASAADTSVTTVGKNVSDAAATTDSGVINIQNYFLEDYTTDYVGNNITF